MASKLEALIKLENMGLNVHNYCAFDPLTLKPVQGYKNDCGFRVETSKSYTIRFDTSTENCLGLPFTILDESCFDFYDFMLIRNKAIELGCYLIVSDGKQYDKFLRYNIVCKVETNGDFMYESSPLQIPLRHMYRHPLTCVIGNITEPEHWWDVYKPENSLVNLVEVRHIVENLYNKEIFGDFVEFTMYNQPVGRLKEDMVYWHVC